MMRRTTVQRGPAERGYIRVASSHARNPVLRPLASPLYS
jgi:hypothetical protein